MSFLIKVDTDLIESHHFQCHIKQKTNPKNEKKMPQLKINSFE